MSHQVLYVLIIFFTTAQIGCYIYYFREPLADRMVKSFDANPSLLGQQPV